MTVHFAQAGAAIADNAQTVLLGVLSYLAVEMRTDVKKMRDMVTVMWSDRLAKSPASGNPSPLFPPPRVLK